MTPLRRRELLTSGLLGAGFLAFGPAFWRDALAGAVRAGAGPYGPLLEADAHGVRLPAGFSGRVVARAGRLVANTMYPWHVYPDGQATFATDDGGWVLVSNSESRAAAGGGASAIRFAADGTVRSAYRICAGTDANCAGGPTPWGTWLTCEEHAHGQVWECDPLGARPAVNRPALGVFSHEAAAVDPHGGRVYMTEDEPDGGLYRFTPDAYPDLSTGRLEIAVRSGAEVRWARVPDPSAIRRPTRRQVAGSAAFQGGEGIWLDSGRVYFSTKGDGRIWAYDTIAQRIEVLFEPPAGGVPAGLDNLTVSRSGDLFVCEDSGLGSFGVHMLSVERELAPFLRFEGAEHAGSEAAGVVFDPAGGRMYVSSQRAGRVGAVYEISGPFRGPAGPQSRTPAARGPSGAGAGTREDVLPAGLSVRVRRRRVGVEALRRGLHVDVRADGAARVEAALRTGELAARPGRRGSTPRPVTVTLARARAGRGRATLRLAASPAGRARLRRTIRRRRRRRLPPRVRCRLVVQARGPSGTVKVANLRIDVTAGRRRR